MGRGNVCVFGDYEGLFYVDWNNFPSHYEDDEGNSVDDYQLQQDDWEDALIRFKAAFKKRYPSFVEADSEWIDNEKKAVLENGLFYIAVTDNEWSMAVMLIQKEPDYYQTSSIINLQKRFSDTYLAGMKECLFMQFTELGIYGGPWTSGRITRDSAVA